MQIEQEFLPFKLPPVAARFSAAVGAIGIGAGSAFVVAFDPAKSTFFPVCLLYSLTGFACPGCGLTRGFHEMFHGRFIPALDFNLFVPVWAMILGYVWISLILLAVRGRGLPMWAASPRFLWVFLMALLAFGVVRNIPAWPFTILFP